MMSIRFMLSVMMSLVVVHGICAMDDKKKNDFEKCTTALSDVFENFPDNKSRDEEEAKVWKSHCSSFGTCDVYNGVIKKTLEKYSKTTDVKKKSSLEQDIKDLVIREDYYKNWKWNVAKEAVTPILTLLLTGGYAFRHKIFKKE